MFLIFYIFFSVIIVAGALGKFGSVKMEMAFEKRKIELLEKELDLQAILDMDQDGEYVDSFGLHYCGILLNTYVISFF